LSFLKSCFFPVFFHPHRCLWLFVLKVGTSVVSAIPSQAQMDYSKILPGTTEEEGRREVNRAREKIDEEARGGGGN
jgi:hypothetical protein